VLQKLSGANREAAGPEEGCPPIRWGPRIPTLRSVGYPDDRPALGYHLLCLVYWARKCGCGPACWTSSAFVSRRGCPIHSFHLAFIKERNYIAVTAKPWFSSPLTPSGIMADDTPVTMTTAAIEAEVRIFLFLFLSFFLSFFRSFSPNIQPR
jgi:hypothetical protein